MMKGRFLMPVFIVAAAMLACGKTAFTQTDLPGMVYQPGDFPEYHSTPGFQKVTEKRDWDYDQWVQLQVWDEERHADLLVDVILFSDKKELLKAYDELPDGPLQEEMPIFDPPKIGEQIVGKKQEWLDGAYAVNLTYRRCYALVNIWAHFGGTSSFTEESIIEYARALDRRLNNNVCPI